MSQDTNVNNLIINKLTKQQFDGITTPDPTQLYFVTDDNGIESLSNVNISNVANGQILKYNSTTQKWENAEGGSAAVWGNITGTLSNQTDLATTLGTFVDKSSDQTITGVKTFEGSYKILLKQELSGNRMGFTIVDPSATELGALQFNPVGLSNAPLFTLNVPGSTNAYLGFRYWGGTKAINVVAPRAKDTPSSITAGTYYIPLAVTDGTTTVNTANTGVLNISSLIPTVDQTYSASSTNAQSGVAVASAISSAISSVYKPAGSVAFASLPTLSASVLGNVYDVTDAFTTTSDFVEGAGKSYPANTNVVVVDVGTSSSPSYKFDVLSGFVDLSGYQPLLVSGTNIKTVNNNSLLGNGNITIDSLPSQTGNSGKFLTTDGTAASWVNTYAMVITDYTV